MIYQQPQQMIYQTCQSNNFNSCLTTLQTHPSINILIIQPTPPYQSPYNQHTSFHHMSTYRKKIFPLRLPQNFHGQTPTKPLHQQYKQRVHSNQQPNPQLPNNKIVNWQLKRKNNDVINQRKQFLTHTGKISGDTPFWFQTTSDFYRRHQADKLRVREAPRQEKTFDVFNRKRFSLHDWKSNTQPLDDKLFEKRNSMMEKSCAWNVTSKVGDNLSSFSSTQPRSSSINMFGSKAQVTGKVGSVDVRNYSVRKPQMKIGKTQFIDTYSPF